MALHVVGVRHHSPACARLVRATIESLRPRFVLIEGPVDMNDRLGELYLEHELPVAVFSHYDHEGRSHASWTPFCRHSPEWIALTVGRDVGADVRFMDLPAWHSAFDGVTNRYRDHAERGPSYEARLMAELSVDNVDALWDHLFEQAQPLDELARRLDAYFAGLRGEDEADDRDAPREAFMRECIGWALAQGGDVVVVCGGFHAPALADTTPTGGDYPRLDAPSDARSGSYLVPYSWKRLDSFVGYQSGLPSPAYYDAVWSEGAEAASEVMLRRTTEQLRGRKQHVSPADLIACATMTSALARMRGHVAPTRIDLLDGISGALCKDALEVPLPWSYRGTLLPRTDPILVEVMRAFSGQREGKLDARTPRPPLLADVNAQLHALDLEPTPARTVSLDLLQAPDRERSRVLHRLRLLEIPGFVRTRGPQWATDADLKETWRLERPFEQESALIEAAAWGASLEAATTARLEARLLAAPSLSGLAAVLGEAVFVGITRLAVRVLDRVASAVQDEGSLATLGDALTRLAALHRHDALLGARDSQQLAIVLVALYDRGLWLVEGVLGANAAIDEGHVRAVLAMRDLLRGKRVTVDRTRGIATFERRAIDRDAPPALRGAAIGFLWSLGESDNTRATVALADLSGAQTLGDFLAGLLALAREELLDDEALLGAIDTAVLAYSANEFLVGLPALRLAFSYLPPREREVLAKKIVARHGGSAPSLLSLEVSPAIVARGMALDAEITHVLTEYGLA